MPQPTPGDVHVDHYLGEEKGSRKRRRKEKGKAMTETVQKLEALVYKRDFTQAQRKQLASEGKALANESYPIETAADLGPAATLARSGHGDVAAAKALIARRAKQLGVRNPLEAATAKKAEAGTVEITVELVKGEFEGKVYGIVLEPDLPDSQDDEVTPEDIEKACHAHLQEALEPDVQHSGRSAGAHLIEHYIAPVDFTLPTPDGPREVRKGSWVQAYQVEDPVVKEEVRTGKLTGFSLEGTGIRLPIAA